MKWLVIVNLIALSQATTLSKTNFFRNQLPLPLEAAEAEPIAPYSFSYISDAIDGSSARQETSDGTGVVRGSYTISSADGIKRTVNYIADENGFRAQVQTNEPGTESKSPANVQFASSQPPAEEIALKFGPKPTLEQLPEVRTILKQTPNTFTPLLNQNTLINVPLVKKLDTILPSTHLTQGFSPLLQPQLKPIEAPIRLLTKLQAPQIPVVSTQLKPLGFEVQQREELIQTRENY